MFVRFRQTKHHNQVRRLGVLMGFAESDPAGQAQLKAFRASLTKFGWTQGDNLKIEVRWGVPIRTARRCWRKSSSICGLTPS